jgi:hypothetical protein
MLLASRHSCVRGRHVDYLVKGLQFVAHHKPWIRVEKNPKGKNILSTLFVFIKKEGDVCIYKECVAVFTIEKPQKIYSKVVCFAMTTSAKIVFTLSG